MSGLCCDAQVRKWHEAAEPGRQLYSFHRGQTGHDADSSIRSRLPQLSDIGRASDLPFISSLNRLSISMLRAHF
jgi:hypothetical protein